MVDTCAAEFAAETPYFYSTYAAAGSPPEAPPVARPASLVIGSGPVRIGQGIEFDYCAVQAADALRRLGHSAVMVNSNPETVSTDFDASSRLYFESLDAESVLEVLRAETLDGATARRVRPVRRPDAAGPGAGAGRRRDHAARPDLDAIDQTEERMRFAGLVDRLGIPQPEGGMASSVEEAFVVAERVGYPVIVRPSFVIGGLAVDFAYGPDDLAEIIERAVAVDDERPVRIDAYLEGIELDVDAITDGDDVLIPGLIEHVERAGVHSGDSIGVYPPQRISAADQELVVDAITRIAPRDRRARPDQRPVHRARRRRLPARGQPARVANRAVPVEGDGRADDRAGHARRPGRYAARAGLGGGLMDAAAVRRGQGAGLLDGQAARSGPDARAGDAVDRRGDRDPHATRAWRWPRRSPRRRCGRRSRPRAAASHCCRSPSATSLCWRELAGALARAGYRFCATRGTALALQAAGYEVEEVARVDERPDDQRSVLDAILSGEVTLVVNTPSPESRPMRDAGAIRRAALAEGILCLTSIDTALAAAQALDPEIADELADVRPLDEWLSLQMGLTAL